MPTDYYGVLGLSQGATDADIKRAYRKLARDLHPDVNPAPEAKERFQEVSRAYECLTDPDKRRIVDLGGDPYETGGGGGSPFGGGAAGFGGLGDIMDAFFGGAGGAARGPRSRTRAGGDALLRLDLDLDETVFGTTSDITVDTAVLCDLCAGAGTAAGTHPTTCTTCNGRGEVQSVQRSFLGQVVASRPCPTCTGTGQVIPEPCSQCGGDGRVRARRTIPVKIPAGVEDGMRIRLTGHGEVGPGGGPAGDLYIEVHERPHDVFTRDGEDLHCRVTLPMSSAALGTTLNLKTLDGDEEIDVKPGTQAGSLITLRAHGAPRLRGTGRGNLVVHVDVQTPTRLDEEQERLLREFAALRGEDRADSHREAQGGLFSRVRDAFNGR
ncbi:molecular chaperone DnaJ [Modestobacter sp. I12A-02628]|uniref:Chaperone protein DnaJ n=1 Tax=Goekera deserti TaxID=2497753 RepID=A0A7K3WCH2_9ACTN|nr:molecular chaperone DnaJ [Goekera deserti]MPQ97496.1 molecular chaperone DnaJ [Goekera deserti]NDI47901.1 molecular chaperone DnaJ [Goekera deserti]NEL53649.1 molecular chaperone DnaJ [Goekera deserti]